MRLDQAPGMAAVTSVTTSQATVRRLAELGVRAGCHVRVLYRTTGGGLVVAVDGSRVALDAATVRSIDVEPVQ